MLGVNLTAVIVIHLLTVAMISGDQSFSTEVVDGFDKATNTFIKRFDCFDRRSVHARMPYHVAVGVIDHD